ncbi:MAG: branched-chain amino acid ABC transporter permease [Kofleriaceae bacterium]
MKSLQERVTALRPNLGVAIGLSALPFAIAIVLAFAVELVVGPAIGGTWSKILLDVGIAIVLAGSLNVVNGFAGQFSIGQAGFMLVGAYASAWLTFYGSIHWFGVKGDVVGGFLGGGQLLFLTGCLLGGVLASVFGLIVGLPSLRLRGDYLAIVTLGFGEIVRVLGQITARQPKNFDQIKDTSMFDLANKLGGAEGFSQIPGYTSGGTGAAMFFVFLFAFILLILTYRLKYSSKGRALLAVRENEIAAEAMGVDTTRAKVVAFVFSAFFAGVGGALYAHQVMTIDPKELGFQKSFDLVIIVVIGGMGSITGVVLGATTLVILPEVFREFSDYRMIAYALALILVMILRPQGIMGVQELWEVKWSRLAWWQRGLANLKASSSRNVIAIAAFVAAVLGTFKIAPLVAGPLAIVLAFFGRKFARTHTDSGVGFATGGFILGIVALLLGLLGLYRGFFIFFGDNGVRLWW